MTGRRSGRVKKHFDYSSFLENEKSDESDDDFIGSSAPPPKKAKSSQEEKIKKSENPLTPEKQKHTNANKSTKSKRKKLDEKLFERDIKMAMELSMQDADPENTPESKTSSCETKSEANETPPHKELLYLSRHDIHSPPKSPPVLTLSESNKGQTKNHTNEQPVMPVLTPIMNGPSDDIEFLGLPDEEGKKNNRNRRTSGRMAKKIIEFEPEDSNDDDSEFENQESNSEENSDFEEKPKNKKKKQILSIKSKKENRNHLACTNLSQVHKKTETKKSVLSPLSSAPAQRSTNSIKTVQKSPPSTENINVTSSININRKTTSEQVAPAKLTPRILTWNPFGKSAGNITNLASPPSIRRLGLSRNQKVKPLHPTLKVNH